MEIYHNSRDILYRNPFGAAKAGQSINLALKVVPNKDETIKNIWLRLWQDNTGETLVAMKNYKEDKCLYREQITMPQETGILWYYFVVETNEGPVYLYGNNKDCLGGEGEISLSQPESFQITVYNFAPVPKWFKEGIVYQIFPDRFARDEKWRERCEKVISEWQGKMGQKKFIEEDWYKPAYYETDEEGNVTGWPFYGGSFKGIEEKLDYIKSLGASVIYLNPIALASSNHRYDTADYFLPDPMLGSKEDFVSLTEAARKKGIRIILDGVFSHTGADSKYFDKYGNYGNVGAYNNPESLYRDWFEFKENDPIGYRSWWGIKDLPEVNENNENFIELICGKKGVLETWLNMGASGWRLDVADELPDSFIAKIRKTIKNKCEDNLLLGEVWEDASNKISYGEKRQYLMGAELDSTMNYPVRDLLFDFALGVKGSRETGQRIMSLAENYPRENFYGALNIIGSHDRQRVLTAMGVDHNYDVAADRVRLMATLQYTLPGVPCIYYGDEAGMYGGADPENRSGFIWERENTNLQSFYRLLGVIYNEHSALKSGELKVIETNSYNTFAFVRSNKEENIIVIANNSDEAVNVETEIFKDIEGEYALELLTSREYRISNGHIRENIQIGPRSAAIVAVLKKAPKTMKLKNKAGVICHISSIPGGMLGAPARSFVDYLKSAGMGLWQILPLNPPGMGNSPYSSYGAFAGDERFINNKELPDLDGLGRFREANDYWLKDFAIYTAKRRNITEEQVIREQYYFDIQWQELKKYANSKDIEIIGDLPVFVSRESADVKGCSDQFQIDENGNLKCHAGVPPDYFSPDGQDWGNPLYNWEHMNADGYSWWTKRLAQCFRRYDYVRLDHFRSFSEYYSIPEGKLATEGLWQKGPGIEFFRKISENLGENGSLRILAEDLGQLDCGVWNLLKLSGYPGMNVWQFSGEEIKAMSPEEQARRVFYTGTHDNQTLLGWCHDNGMNKSHAEDIIRYLYNTKAPWVIMQLQDMLMLGDEARMNVPGVAEGNWGWKVPDKFIKDGKIHTPETVAYFKALAEISGRSTETSSDRFMKEKSMICSLDNISDMAEDFGKYYKQKIAKGHIKGVKCPDDKEDRLVISIDMGGTNTRVALVDIRNGKLEIKRQIQAITPGREDRVTYIEAFKMVAEMIRKVDENMSASQIGFSFSFPQEPCDNGDAIILKWAKEMLVDGGEGLKAGELLSEALEKVGYKKLPIMVINDTVATLLAGEVMDGGERCLTGFVLGTGGNVCFMDSGTGLIYCLESGDYPYFPLGEFDKILDSESSDKGCQLAEKTMSGAYIHRLKEITGEGLRKFQIANLANAETSKTEGDTKASANKESADASTTAEIAESYILEEAEGYIMRRGALYSAIIIEGALRLANADGENYRDFRVPVDGSVFWKAPGFAKIVKEYLIKINKRNEKITFIKLEGAGLCGAAAAAGERSK